MIGTTLAHYEILASIGRGGMGEVWKARDTKLGREVAIKALPQEFATDTERVARLEREAKLLATLNHPNIGGIYGLEHVDGTRFLVLELIEGETLADLASRGPLPVDDALKVSRQIAEALEAAHEKGVIHRDLKPANIKVTPDGTVKVLDFGLAKALAGDNSASNVTQSPTISLAATRQGVILGTAAYMAPEQARGRTVDRRADIWAFGCVLYELLAGQPAFKGEDVSEILAAALKEQPDWSKVPLRTQRLLKRCLEKDPKQRLRDIADAWALLDADEPRVEPAAPRAPASRWLWPTTAAAFAIVAGVAVWAPWRVEPERPLVRLEVDLGPDVKLPSTGTGSIALSPDGTRLTYVGVGENDSTQLFTRRLDQSVATPLPGTNGAQYPFYSPDGQWIGFVALSRINKVSVEGGAVVPIGDYAGILPGTSWADDDTIVAGGLFSAGLRRIPARGGEWVTMTQLERPDSKPGRVRDSAHAFPQVLPGGHSVLFVAYGRSPDVDEASIEVVSLSDGARKTVVRGGTSPKYVPSGHLLYVNKGTLFAVPFDVERAETRGTAVPIVKDVQIDPRTSAADVTVSRDGTLAYRAGPAGMTSALGTVQWVDDSGNRSLLTPKPGYYQQFRLSPDGKRVVLLLVEGSSSDIWVFDSVRNTMNKTTFTLTANAPIWTPDGRHILFSALPFLWWTRADGAGEPKQLLRADAIRAPSSFSPDGTQLAFVEVAATGPKTLTVPIDQANGELKAATPAPFAESQFMATSPEFSPDGRWIAYVSNESGRSEVYVRPFAPSAPVRGGRTLVSEGGGTSPRWARNVHELFYVSGERLMARSYTVSGNAFVAGGARVRIEKLGGTVWDLAPDGRVAVLTPADSPRPQPRDHTVVFLQNFFDHLRRVAPVG
jgi:serine/threonine-protein kinase